jgi:hypothetical protein
MYDLGNEKMGRVSGWRSRGSCQVRLYPAFTEAGVTASLKSSPVTQATLESTGLAGRRKGARCYACLLLQVSFELALGLVKWQIPFDLE